VHGHLKFTEKPNSRIETKGFRYLNVIDGLHHDRMTRAYGTDFYSGDFSDSYQYDASGNLVRPGVTYDDKVRIYRTNDIWMFLMRDYSKNNAVVANEYNAAGYPTFVNNSSTPFGIMGADLRFARINYGCRPSNYY